MIKITRKIIFAARRHQRRGLRVLFLIAFIFMWTRDRPLNELTDLIPTNYRTIVNAHALQPQGKNIPIAVVDSGLQRDHKDYSSNLGRSWHLTDYTGDHGSSVISVITKIAPKCEIYFFDNSNPLSALEHALHSPARIINLSWSCDYEAIRTILIKLAQAGKIIVMSAGNESIALGHDLNTRNLIEIAGLPELKGRLLLVAGIDHHHSQDFLSPYSNYAGFQGQPVVCAPGSRILTATQGHQHSLRDGTSFAAPQVTGLLALLMEEFPYYPPEWYVELVKDSARKWRLDTHISIDPRCGYGIIHAKDAITLGRKRQKVHSHLSLKPTLKPVYKSLFMSAPSDLSKPFALNRTLHEATLEEVGRFPRWPLYFETQLSRIEH